MTHFFLAFYHVSIGLAGACKNFNLAVSLLNVFKIVLFLYGGCLIIQRHLKKKIFQQEKKKENEKLRIR